MNEGFDIKYVALYLRKSRGEGEQDLENHRYMLVNMCKENNWRYLEYKEIASSETIEYRPEFKKLLKDVQEGLFDAVLVVDYQRLGRGEIEDQGLIKRVFKDSRTYIVTPEKIYNLVDDTDDLLVDVSGLLARQEFKSIKRNLQRGKKIGAKLGRWTNGTPPFPYRYEASIKNIVVDEEKNKIYQEMKNMILNEHPCYEVCWYLNNRGVKSPRGGIWHENTVRRIMLDETHLGKKITNKTEGSAHKNKKTKPLRQLPREEWDIVENSHEAVKTQEEHEQILTIFSKRKIVPHRSRSGTYILSGIVYCSKCGKSMQFTNKETKNGNVAYIRKCQKSDPYGNRCENRGIIANAIYDAINIEVQAYESQLLKHEEYENQEEIKRIQDVISFKQSQINKLNNALARIKELYEIGDYTREEYQDRKKVREREITSTQNEIEELKAKQNVQERVNNKERIIKIKEFKQIWSAEVENKVKNQALKKIISRINYERDENGNAKIDIVFN
ncbi:recombinase family protein [Virgibacillus pantothenticus]|uniref:Recombinase n=1 Tax=Virgibacillus pantothenticus TaxID=1473 RepID=A0A0L0QM08_VIRPA|nr:recombinase family protein [Virgibacillus pantothenticus]KNE19655.1 hypothetical protein AFK71_14445 [Virgibacillus pantothenticus]MBU8567569.1 recombinase family protein [Virgibacillus pantothenticus]MBU8601357.1 recombinase family protein [Virgibacillus pantothenticus]MBU8636174.1 recombinase family protein [Virgibacillus pantothenticus]MBU8643694.1 recombinase family protein [Virgibacillus pantothenticus]